MSYYVPGVDPEKVKASFKNGELVITLPVQQEDDDNLGVTIPIDVD